LRVQSEHLDAVVAGLRNDLAVQRIASQLWAVSITQVPSKARQYHLNCCNSNHGAPQPLT